MLAPLETLKRFPAHDYTLAGLLQSRAAADPGRAFLIFEDATTSWGEAIDTVQRTVSVLRGRSIVKGDRVAIMAPNSDAYVTLFCALASIGAISVPLNPDFTIYEAAYVLGHAEVSTVFCTPTTLPIARQAVAAVAQKPAFLLLEGEDANVKTLRDLAASAPAAALTGKATADDVCLIMYTSGTTGFPKGVMHSQRSLVLTGEAFVERMRLQPDDRLLCILPLFHINALFYSLGGALAAGASLVLTVRFSASGFWPLVTRTDATEVNIIAAVGSILARRPRSEFMSDHRLTKVYGAGTPAAVFDAFEHEFGVKDVIEGYGMTEVPGVCNQPFDGPRPEGAMGRAARHPDSALPFAELRVVDEDGLDVEDGVTGELLVRTPVVMKGYYRDPEQTAAAFRDGWFRTGDLVRRDAERYFYFVARKSDIIRRRGENIAAAEIERVIVAHPAVIDAAAVAVPSDLGEDEVLLAIVAVPGLSLTPADVASWCAQRLAPTKRPRYVTLLSELPHTPTHRVAKFQLDRQALLAAAADLQGPA